MTSLCCLFQEPDWIWREAIERSGQWGRPASFPAVSQEVREREKHGGVRYVPGRDRSRNNTRNNPLQCYEIREIDDVLEKAVQTRGVREKETGNREARAQGTIEDGRMRLASLRSC